MRYWWVNQNQTYRQEIGGGYLWSPKRKSDGARNPFYESMREVAPGDLIFSFVDTFIYAVGTARSYCRESPKPTEFGLVGQNWENIGWKVTVDFLELKRKIKPKDHIEVLRPLLPAKYSPLRPDGDGQQAVYLTGLPTEFAEVLIGLIGQDAIREATVESAVARDTVDEVEDWEQQLERQVATERSVPVTTRNAIVSARVGQGLFKQRVAEIEACCRITRVENSAHLVASHCKPWRDSTNDERLNGENGLLLTPSIDHLFDRGFIGFEDDGRLIVSPVADRSSLRQMGVEVEGIINVGTFTEGQKRFLSFHRDFVLLRSTRV